MSGDNKELAGFVGKVIASRRTQAGLTQEEIAETLGVGDEAIWSEAPSCLPLIGSWL